jgi:hypothetical protein
MSSPRFDSPVKKPRSAGGGLLRLAGVILLGLAGAGLIVGAYWWVKIRPRTGGPEMGSLWARFGHKPVALPVIDTVDEFDITVKLPADPLGIAATPEGFFIGNRIAPGGMIRVASVGPGYRVEMLPVREPAFNQELTLQAIAFNGHDFIGVVDGAWLQQSGGSWFVKIDSRSRKTEPLGRAPEQLGCLTWDGTGYWGATRKNKEDETGEAWLYRLDDRFKVKQQLKPPGVGCQGIAWDGRHLWFADVFDDALYMLAVGADGAGGFSEARIVHSHNPRTNYLSGLAWDGKSLWLTEYEGKALHRLHPKLHAAWSQLPELLDDPFLAGPVP